MWDMYDMNPESRVEMNIMKNVCEGMQDRQD